MTDAEHLQWIHDRLIHRYDENSNVDYMIRLRAIIVKVRSLKNESVPQPKENQTQGAFVNRPKKIREKRTLREIIDARRSGSGCCERYCDQMACDCMALRDSSKDHEVPEEEEDWF